MLQNALRALGYAPCLRTHGSERVPRWACASRVRGYDLAARQRLLLQFIPREREEPSPRECAAAECVAGFGGEVQPKTVLLNSQYWLGRAEEARLLADEMIYPDYAVRC
jgi:hypothetical protein